jgi:HSP20 family protein
MLNRSLTSTLDRMMTLNRAIDEAFAAGVVRSAGDRVWVPALDIVEKADAYTLYAELPGVDKSSIDVQFEQNVLTLKGTKPAATDAREGEVRVFAAERVSGAFERTVRLPSFVDAEQIAATYVDGLLTITIPKAKAAQARKIEL